MTRSKSLLLFGSLACLVASDALAFRLIGPPARRWYASDLPITLEVDPRGRAEVVDGDNGMTAVLDKIESWDCADGNNPAVGNLLDVVVTSQPPPSDHFDGRNTLRWDDPGGDCTGGCLAATFIFRVDTGTTTACNGYDMVPYLDTDIIFNEASIPYSSELEPSGCSREYYLEGVTVHEVGHALGLAHSEKGNVVMTASASWCRADRNRPKDDDEAGIGFLYDCEEGGGPPCGDCTDGDGDGYCAEQDDCDDADPSVNPGAAEVCDNGVDDDCDGQVDGADADCGGCVPTEEVVNGVDDDCDGLVDCDDPDVRTQNERGPRGSDGLDNDCNGIIDG